METELWKQSYCLLNKLFAMCPTIFELWVMETENWVIKKPNPNELLITQSLQSDKNWKSKANIQQKKEKKKTANANQEKKKVKRWSKVAAVDLLCVFNYNIVIELWVMETKNSQKLFSISITHNSKIKELSDGNRVIVCQTNFLLWVPPFLNYKL